MMFFVNLCFFLLTFGDALENKQKQDFTSLRREHEIKLGDFFWTGSGDGPPEFVKNLHNPNKSEIEIIIKTETLLATVYVQDNDIPDQLCLDCNLNGEKFLINITTDRRFWLLTAVAGFVDPSEIWFLEEKMADIYRIAFTRQQSQHLGLPLQSANFSTGQNQTQKNRRSIGHKKDGNLKQNLTIINFDENITHKTLKILDRQQVRVIIHNLTHVTEDDLKDLWQPYFESLDTKPINLTEIIYSVYVNTNPVLAITAAEDMKLVQKDEMGYTLAKNILSRAEPYLKEPLATPLVPPRRISNFDFLKEFSNNPLLIITSTILFFLLIFLIFSLVILQKTKRKHNHCKRYSTRQQQLLKQENRNFLRKNLSIPPNMKSESYMDGNENIAFEEELNIVQKNYKKPSINFPLPPLELEYQTQPSSPSTSTSDSSIYGPLNRPPINSFEIMDENSKILFEKKQQVELNKNIEPIYTTVEDFESKRRRKNKRKKYLSSNQVGSIEKLNNSTYLTSDQEINFDEINNMGLNPKKYYNELFENSVPIDSNRTINHSKIKSKHIPIEAINENIHKSYRSHENYSESGSIGSFLSMLSIKSFPRNNLPEPLHRVLEPVSVLHLDHNDHNESIPNKSENVCNLSDTTETGVIGPPVWRMYKLNSGVIVGDAAATRNRYEGLLEGALELYTDEKKHTSSEINRNHSKDIRGKSALISAPNEKNTLKSRPQTADPLLSHCYISTEPPSPNIRAWSSGATSPHFGSYNTRPLSSQIDLAIRDQATYITDKSAAPLIEALQSELNKFKEAGKS